MVESTQELDAKLKDPSLDSENHEKVEGKQITLQSCLLIFTHVSWHVCSHIDSVCITHNKK